MSLATFKKKTQNSVGTMSTGQAHFSINGTRRLQGYVGQNTISRSFPKTPMSGNTAKGHGGCCGTYYNPLVPISPLCAGDFTNDPTEIKSSVLSNSGQLELRFRPEVYKLYKPDDSNNQSTSGQYTEQLSACAQTPYCSSQRVVNNPALFPDKCCNNPLLTQSTNYQQRSSQATTITKDSFAYTAIDQGSYIASLRNQTSQIDQTKYRTMIKPGNMPPFGATVQQQPKDPKLATQYAPISRNFFLQGIKRLQQCVPGKNLSCPTPV
jgi:hypothetical protein